MKRFILGIVIGIALVAGSVGAQNTVRLTNTQYNAESTGNVLTLPFTQFWVAATCEADGPYFPGWSWTDPSNAISAECISGTDALLGLADFPNSGPAWIENSFRLPSDWTGTMQMNLLWLSSATTGNVVWQLLRSCTADGEINQAFAAAQTVVDATKASGGQFNTATFSSITTSGCAAGESFAFKIYRDPAHASDTMTDTAKLINVELVYRRAI